MGGTSVSVESSGPVSELSGYVQHLYQGMLKLAECIQADESTAGKLHKRILSELTDDMKRLAEEDAELNKEEIVEIFDVANRLIRSRLFRQ